MNWKFSKPTFFALTIATTVYLLLCHHHPALTIALVISTFIMTAFSWISAANILGLHSAAKMSFLSIVFGMLAEYTGTQYGWFFGEYIFTDVLGPKLWGVPIVIPMMWFTLAYIGYIMATRVRHQRV